MFLLSSSLCLHVASCGGGVIMMSSSVQRRGHYVVMDRLQRLGSDHPRDNRVLECTLPPLQMETKLREHFTITGKAPTILGPSPV